MKVLNLDKDPSGQTYLLQTALHDLGLYDGRLDNWRGPATDAAEKSFRDSLVESSDSGDRPLKGDGTWPWTAEVSGADVIVRNARATCFGGSGDPQDGGGTASGISTADNPGIEACSLPMDGRMFKGLSPGEHRALDGSPIPRVPWKTLVQVTRGVQTFTFPVIDLGPGKRTGNALDLTIAAARRFDSKASATNFEAQVDFRILDGAKFAT